MNDLFLFDPHVEHLCQYKVASDGFVTDLAQETALMQDPGQLVLGKFPSSGTP
jgi:hypothetical protein